MVLENMIIGVQITDRNHPIRILTITLNQDVIVENGQNKNNSYLNFTTLLKDVHFLYRLVARKQTGKKGIRLPQDAVPPGPLPDWVGQSDYCCVFINREGERCVDITLANARTLVINNSNAYSGNEIELFYQTLQHYLPR